MAGICSIDQDVIEIYHNTDINLFRKNIINITLKTSWYIDKTKGHDLKHEVVIFGIKSCLSFVIISDSHFMIYINQV